MNTVHRSSLETLPDSACTNILVGHADEKWLLFYLGGKAQALSPWTDMEGFDKSKIYFTAFDDHKIKGDPKGVDTRPLVDYNNTPMEKRALKRWMAEVVRGYRLKDIISFIWKDVITENGQHAQLVVQRSFPETPNMWKLIYRSNAGNRLPDDHQRMAQLFFSAIDGSTFEIMKLESPVPAWRYAGESAQLSNVHGGVTVGYDDRAFKAICEYCRSRNIPLDPYERGNDYHPAVFGMRIERKLPTEWLENVHAIQSV